MADILDNVSMFVSRVITWMQCFLASIVGGSGTLTTGSTPVTYTYQASPLLIIFVIALPLCGLGIGILRRIIKTRG